MSIGADYRPRILLTVRGAADTIWQMGTPPKPPPQSPTSSGSSEASPKNPGAAAPGPTSSIEVSVEGEGNQVVVVAGKGASVKIRRECGGVIRLDRK